jgi:hypothetical protein
MPKGLFPGSLKGSISGLHHGLNSGQSKGLLQNDRYNNRNFLKVAIVGHSIADSAATEKVPVKRGTLYGWINGAIEHITGQSYANDARNLNEYSGLMQHFGPQFKAAFNRPVFFVSGAHGGSVVSDHVDPGQTWYITGTLYNNFRTKAAAGLRAIGGTKFDAILIDLGINDVRAGYSFSDINTGITSLLTRITTDFPGVPILIDQVGRYETQTCDQPLVDIRHLWLVGCQAFADVHIASSAAPLAVQNGFRSDAIHKNALGYSIQAGQIVRWFKNSQFPKWSRTAMSILYDDQPYYRKKLIDNFVSSQISAGNWFLIEQLLIFKTSHPMNAEVDWAMLGFGALRTVQFVNGSHIATDGVATRYDTTYSPSLFTRRSTVSNIRVGIKLKTGFSTNNTFAFGVISTGPKVMALSISSNKTTYRVHDTTLSLGTEAGFGNNSWYSADRNGTTKAIVKGKTIDASVVQADTGLVVARTVKIGCVDNAGTLSSFAALEAEAFVACAHTSFDWDNFHDNIEILLANW